MLNNINNSSYFNFKRTSLSISVQQVLKGSNLLNRRISMKESKTSNLVEEDNKLSLTPDQALLDKAREVIELLSETSELPETRPFMQRRLQAYVDSLESSIKLLLKRDHKIVFIGSAGVGKSTAICELLGLVTPETKGSRSVLETGSDNTTVCEVQVIEGHAYGIQTTPCTDDELRVYVKGFAEYLLNATKTETKDANPDATQGVSKEVDRALRNMSGLKIRREKQEDGKNLSIDEAKELAKQFTSVRDLTNEIMKFIGLHNRDCKEVWYDDNQNQESLEWLKDNFAKINNGRHDDFSLPKLIEVIVPFELLCHHECSSVRVIDTKGIDGTAVMRDDLNCHLGDTHTLTVLCNRFNDAPAAAPQLILEGAKARGIQSLPLNTILFILPRAKDALAEKYDDSGEYVETVKDGYELKEEKIQAKLVPLGLDELPIYFFNSEEDDVNDLRNFLSNRLTAMRENLRQQLNNTIQDAETTLANYEQQQFQEVQRQAGKMLQSWISINNEVSPPFGIHIYDAFIREINRINAGKVRASIRLKGKLLDLDYYYHWEYGTDLLATSLLNEKVIGFNSHCSALINNSDLAEAKELINQANNVLSRAFFDLKEIVKPKSKELFIVEIESFAAELWEKSAQEWGRKQKDLEESVKKLGYRERVAIHHKEWFANQRRVELERQIYALIVSEWQSALEKVSALLETE
jgi:energy-coupling factor transporter ATP-binding protein EcfA2